MRSVLIFLFLLQSVHVYAGKIDSLQNEINHSGNDAARQANLYCALSSAQVRLDKVASEASARKALALAKQVQQDSIISKAYLRLTVIYENTGRIDDAFLVLDSAARYAATSNNFTCSFWVETWYGTLNRRKAHFEKALQYGYKALKIAETNKDLTLQAQALNGLGVMYTTLDDLHRAEGFHLQSLEIRKKLGDPGAVAKSYNNLGIVNRDLGRYDKALEYYYEVYNIYLRLGDSSSIAFITNDIGAAYSKKGDVTNAERFLNYAIGIRERINEKNELAYTYNYLGENYERKKDLELGAFYIKKALATAMEIGNSKQTYEAYESLSDFYARNSIYDSAYRYAMVFKHYRDSVAHADNEKTIAELTTRYETQKKEQKIKEQQLELKQRNYMLAGAGISVLLAALLSSSYYRRYKLKQAARLDAEIAKQQQMAARAVIEAEENERQRIAADLHDGVGQMMSAVKLNLSALADGLSFKDNAQEIAYEKTLLLVDESCKEVRSVSHNIMPNALLSSGLSSAISAFINKIDNSVIEINFYSEGLNEKIDDNTEIVLYRVIQECVNNVIKHSGANRLDISLIKDIDGISITLEDNGKGFDTKLIKSSPGLGVRNIITRIEYLNGTVEWDSLPGKGTVVTVHI